MNRLWAATRIVAAGFVLTSSAYGCPASAAYADLGPIADVRTLRAAVARDLDVRNFNVTDVTVVGDEAVVGIGGKGYMTVGYVRRHGTWRAGGARDSATRALTQTLRLKRYADSIAAQRPGHPRKSDPGDVCAVLARDLHVRTIARDVDDVVVATNAAYGRVQEGGDSFNLVVRRNGDAGWTHASALGSKFPDESTLLAYGVSVADAHTIFAGLARRYATPLAQRRSSCA